MVRDGLREAAVPVRDEARARFARYDARSASRYGISVRRTGIVSVEQRLRRTTGKHPQFGSLQMRRALIPALQNNVDETIRRLDAEMAKWAARWERNP